MAQYSWLVGGGRDAVLGQISGSKRRGVALRNVLGLLGALHCGIAGQPGAGLAGNDGDLAASAAKTKAELVEEAPSQKHPARSLIRRRPSRVGSLSSERRGRVFGGRVGQRYPIKAPAWHGW